MVLIQNYNSNNNSNSWEEQCLRVCGCVVCMCECNFYKEQNNSCFHFVHFPFCITFFHINLWSFIISNKNTKKRKEEIWKSWIEFPNTLNVCLSFDCFRRSDIKSSFPPFLHSFICEDFTVKQRVKWGKRLIYESSHLRIPIGWADTGQCSLVCSTKSTCEKRYVGSERYIQILDSKRVFQQITMKKKQWNRKSLGRCEVSVVTEIFHASSARRNKQKHHMIFSAQHSSMCVCAFALFCSHFLYFTAIILT